MTLQLRIDVTGVIRLIKEFEREARNDSMPANELTERKAVLVNELNNFISIKKTQTQIVQKRMELLAGPSEKSDEGQAYTCGLKRMKGLKLVGRKRHRCESKWRHDAAVGGNGSKGDETGGGSTGTCREGRGRHHSNWNSGHVAWQLILGCGA